MFQKAICELWCFGRDIRRARSIIWWLISAWFLTCIHSEGCFVQNWAETQRPSQKAVSAAPAAADLTFHLSSRSTEGNPQTSIFCALPPHPQMSAFPIRTVYFSQLPALMDSCLPRCSGVVGALCAAPRAAVRKGGGGLWWSVSVCSSVVRGMYNSDGQG